MGRGSISSGIDQPLNFIKPEYDNAEAALTSPWEKGKMKALKSLFFRSVPLLFEEKGLGDEVGFKAVELRFINEGLLRKFPLESCYFSQS